jgi:hypothetical protein
VLLYVCTVCFYVVFVFILVRICYECFSTVVVLTSLSTFSMTLVVVVGSSLACCFSVCLCSRGVEKGFVYFIFSSSLVRR